MTAESYGKVAPSGEWLRIIRALETIEVYDLVGWYLTRAVMVAVYLLR